MSVTLILIAITCAVTFVAWGNPKMLEALILWPPAVTRNNDYYRLISYGLVHADFMHLLLNMMTLFFFGRVMERFYQAAMGDYGFAFFYVLGLVVSILPTFLKNRNNPEYRSLGASGAVSAVLFSFILFEPWSNIYLFFSLPLPAIVFAVLYMAYTIYSDRKGSGNINHSAHLWGAVYGVAFTLIVEPRVFSLFLEALSHPSFG
jgi:membrane associated rhomboid family serine protease